MGGVFLFEPFLAMTWSRVATAMQEQGESSRSADALNGIGATTNDRPRMAGPAPRTMDGCLTFAGTQVDADFFAPVGGHHVRRSQAISSGRSRAARDAPAPWAVAFRNGQRCRGNGRSCSR